MGDEEREPPGTYTITNEAGEPIKSIGFTGIAKAEYANGDIYEGHFQDGMRHGKGKYTYFSGDVFDGIFENNVKTGKAYVTYAKGGFFHGHFKEGLREGEGTFKYPNGDIYSGMWKAGKKSGKGTYVFNKTKYEYKGDWKDGQMIQGAWSLRDKFKYVGHFQSQKPFGDGAWHTSQGTIVEGAYVQQVVPIDSEPPAPPGGVPATATKAFWKTAAMVAVED
uniref:MORN repeat-containing protein 5 n=1 Tax=Alexandrium monilatum TaxID=311494 RepID=A0A7S4UH35_9DINO